VVIVCLLVLMLVPGCASRTRTVKPKKQVHYAAQEAQLPAEPVVAETQTTTTTTTRHQPVGLLSSAVHLVGEILALPFRLVGGLIRLVF